MKKTLLIMVALVALVANSAVAGESCNMKIYGRAHFSLESLNDSENSGLFLSNNSSRIGFKGMTELNDSMSAIWQIETKIEFMDGNQGEGAVSWGSRNTYAGLKFEMGALKFGYIDTPLKTMGRKFDYFGDTLGDSRNVLSFAENGVHLDKRFDNVIMFSTKDFDGFCASVAYELSDKEMITEDDTYADISANAFYKKEQFVLAGAVQMRPDGQWGDPDMYETQTTLRGAGKYMAENFSGALLIQMMSNVEGDEDVSSMVLGLGGDFDVNEKITLKGQYYMLTASVEGMDEDPKGAQLSLGADYNVAKGTKFYGIFSMSMNDEDAPIGMCIGGGGHGHSVEPLTGDESATGFGVGMIHNF